MYCNKYVFYSFISFWRTLSALDETTRIIQSLNSSIEIVPVAIDFSQVTDCALDKIFFALSAAIQRSTSAIPILASPFSTVTIIHNAGSLGDVSRTVTQMTDVSTADAYMRAHITAPIALNARFFQWVRSNPELNPSLSHVPSVRRTLLCVNISSLLAVQPLASFSLYCSSRAARDMFIRVLAAEECRTGSDSGSGESSVGEASTSASSTSPSPAPSAASGDWRVRALSYAPGPLDTEMQVECREKVADPVVRASFFDLLQSGRVVRPEDSARRLVQLIHDDRFADGAHIDYFDPLP